MLNSTKTSGELRVFDVGIISDYFSITTGILKVIYRLVYYGVSVLSYAGFRKKSLYVNDGCTN